jgi:hypothetical protein
MTFTVNNTAAKIVGALEVPATNTTLKGVATFSGYVYSPGHKITSATLIIDGVSSASQTPNLSRTDICENLKEADACPGIGFKMTFDTGRLVNGPHIVGIRAVNDLGDFLVFPAEVNGGINIFTQN